MTINGIDVYHGDGDIAWKQVYNAGDRFAFVKATEGVSFVDPAFARNYVGASEAGLYVGAYHYGHSTNDPLEEATFFAKIVKPIMKPNNLPPVLDFEDPGFRSIGSSGAAAWAAGWMSTVEQLMPGISCEIYMSLSWSQWLGAQLMQKLLDGNRRRLWIARYGPEPGQTPYTFWQYSDSGTVAGVPHPVDLDVFRGNMSDLMALAQQAGGVLVAGELDYGPFGAPWQQNYVGARAHAQGAFLADIAGGESESGSGWDGSQSPRTQRLTRIETKLDQVLVKLDAISGTETDIATAVGKLVLPTADQFDAAKWAADIAGHIESGMVQQLISALAAQLGKP